MTPQSSRPLFLRRLSLRPYFLRLSRVVLAALAVGATAAIAASGFTMLRSQEALVKPGMTVAQVHDTLGRPSINRKYRNQPGPTYTYIVVDRPDLRFDIDFGADGKVASASERSEMPGGNDGRAGL
ncbi:hypothetical protein BH09PSE5_BH09PSE5_11720 [soil metagenome]